MGNDNRSADDDRTISRREFDAFIWQYHVDRERAEHRGDASDQRQWLIVAAIFVPILADFIIKLVSPSAPVSDAVGFAIVWVWRLVLGGLNV